MTSPISASTTSAPQRRDAAEQLRAASRDLEAVFVEQLFKAMRETVPEGGLTSGGSGEAMFSALLDQHLASQVPERTPSGLAEAVYRQLCGAAGLPDATRPAEVATPATAAAVVPTPSPYSTP